MNSINSMNSMNSMNSVKKTYYSDRGNNHQCKKCSPCQEPSIVPMAATWRIAPCKVTRKRAFVTYCSKMSETLKVPALYHDVNGDSNSN